MRQLLDEATKGGYGVGAFNVNNFEQVGASQLPVGEEGQSQRASCLRGWNLLISASSKMKDEAWEFVRFMTSEVSQKAQTLSSSTLPTLNTLYDDREILEEVPVVALSKEALQNARSRPVSPYYSEMSRTMAEQFNKVLTEATSPEEAVQVLQSELQPRRPLIPLAAYVGEASSLSRAYSTACSKVISCPSARAASKAS
jgi:ABC-type glycerol-3-phosphate transport system substrate-binding protein